MSTLNKKTTLLASILFCSSLSAAETALTNISLEQDENGNFHPSIFIPVYYGSDNQFRAGVGFTSSTSQTQDTINNFSDSKSILVSNEQDLLLNYITYNAKFSAFTLSTGLQSNFSKIKNNEFGYIHDKDNLFGNGADYYIAFDNSVNLDIMSHAVILQASVPLGKYLFSRTNATISPYTTINVKQSTIFKPLVNRTGIRDSSTVQDLSYSFYYEMQTNLNSLIDVGFSATYVYQPLKYNIAQVGISGGAYIFEDALVDSTEITTRYSVQLIINKNLIGGLNPSIGYGIEKLDRENNLNGKTISTDKKIFTLGVQKRF